MSAEVINTPTPTEPPVQKAAPFVSALSAILALLVPPIVFITVATYRGSGVSSVDFGLFGGLMLVVLLGSLGVMDAAKTERAMPRAGFVMLLIAVVVAQLIMGFGFESIANWVNGWMPGVQ